MSSFYGNIKNSNRISLIFDKIYPNRKAMEEACSGDGIFNGRYILIDYGEIKTIPYTRVFPTKEEFLIGVAQNKYWDVTLVPPQNSKYGDLGYSPELTKLYTKNDIDIVYDENGNFKKEQQVYIKREGAIDSKTLNVEPGIDTRPQFRPEISEFVQNKEIDLAQYGDQYQHTVWQKIWTQTGTANTVVEKYIQVANLDAAVPLINLIVDAPSDLDKEGFQFIPTDKNVEGYLTENRYNSLQQNKDSWVYVRGIENGQEVYRPSNDYDIEAKYFMFYKTEYGIENTYEKVYAENGDVLYLKEHKIPQLYEINSSVYTGEEGDTLLIVANRYPIYVKQETNQGTQYIDISYLSGELVVNREYYYFLPTTYKGNQDYYYKPGVEDNGIIIEYTPVSVYKKVIAESGNDFEDGYITRDFYNNCTKDLFYFYDGGNYLSIYTPVEKPAEAAAAGSAIYYKNTLGEYLLKSADNNNYPADYSYYTKEEYDPYIRYWEITPMGAGPHFDPLKSTDLEYMFHMPRPWKFAKDVNFDYNEEGFIPYKRSFNGYEANSVKLETIVDESQLTTAYPEHMPELPDAAEYDKSMINFGNWSGDSYRSMIRMKKQPDTKQFEIKLPELGNIISDVWDIIYPHGEMNEVEGNIPTSEYDENFNNQLLTEDGYAKYYYLDDYKEGLITIDKYEELRDQLFVNVDDNYIKASTYDHTQQYYLFTGTEDGVKYVPVDSDVKIYHPVYDIDELQSKDKLYTFTKSENGEVRVIFIGNDRAPNSTGDNYPGTIGEVVRHAYYLLGLKDDNDTIDNPPRGTIYGLLNGAKTLYGDPKDKMTGTYVAAEVDENNFSSMKDILWFFDKENNAWCQVKDNAYDSEIDYYIVSKPGYQLIPTDISGMEDGYISRELFHYLKEQGRWPIYTYDITDGSFKEEQGYHPDIQYYSDLTTLWAYLNDLKEKFPLYQCDWQNNNSNSIGYIKGRPAMVASVNDTYEATTPIAIDDQLNNEKEVIALGLWNSFHSVPETFIVMNENYLKKQTKLIDDYNTKTTQLSGAYTNEAARIIAWDTQVADIADDCVEELGVEEDRLEELINGIKTTAQDSMIYTEDQKNDAKQAETAYAFNIQNNIKYNFENILPETEHESYEDRIDKLASVADPETYAKDVAAIKAEWRTAVTEGVADLKAKLKEYADIFSNTVQQWKDNLTIVANNANADLDSIQTQYNQIKQKYYGNNDSAILKALYLEIVSALNILYNNYNDDNIAENALTENGELQVNVDLKDLYNTYTMLLNQLQEDYANELEFNKQKYSNYEVEKVLQASDWRKIGLQTISNQHTNNTGTMNTKYTNENTAGINEVNKYINNFTSSDPVAVTLIGSAKNSINNALAKVIEEIQIDTNDILDDINADYVEKINKIPEAQADAMKMIDEYGESV